VVPAASEVMVDLQHLVLLVTVVLVVPAVSVV
jgi:hypothetical protein